MFGLSTIAETVCPKKLASQTQKNKKLFFSSFLTSQRFFFKRFQNPAHRETDRFFAASGVQLAQSTSVQFHYRRAAFSSQIKQVEDSQHSSKSGGLRIVLNMDDTPIVSKSHTHPSHL